MSDNLHSHPEDRSWLKGSLNLTHSFLFMYLPFKKMYTTRFQSSFVHLLYILWIFLSLFHVYLIPPCISYPAKIIKLEILQNRNSEYRHLTLVDLRFTEVLKNVYEETPT